MILLVGDNEDSILYLRTRIELSEEFDLPFSMHAYFGKLGSEEILIVSVGEGTPLVSMKMGYLLEKYAPYVVINIGAISSLQSYFHQGDLFIADRYYLHGVDFSNEGKTVYGQLPGCPSFFTSSAEMNDRAEAAAYRIGGRYVERGFLLSGEKDYADYEEFRGLIARHYNGSEKIAAYDLNSGGIALACQQFNTVLLTIKVVGYEPLHKEQMLSRKRKALEAMDSIGEIIIAVLVQQQSSL